MQIKIKIINRYNQTHKMSIETKDATMQAFERVLKWVKRSFSVQYLEAETSTGWIY
jgi:hypothetical protein|nr:MAG TPA: hypothetical protein [Caudoviricetes sp.]